MGTHRVRAALPHSRHEVFAGRPPHTGQAPEPCQQLAAAARADAGNRVEVRAEVALRPRRAVERDGEAVRLVANLLQQAQGRARPLEGDGRIGVARDDEFLALGQTDGDEIRQTEPLERSGTEVLDQNVGVIDQPAE